MSPEPADELLAVAARCLAREEGRDAILTSLIAGVVDRLDIGSAAIVVIEPEGLRIAATAGLPEAAANGLAAAILNSDHPVARTAADGIAAYDVLPMAPGGPALRSHVPLVARVDGGDRILGVLAVAHDAPMTPNAPLLEAIADLAAVAVRA
ncbi:MAG TPA: hypothetical protein VGM28_04325 [Candidatus Limnocylindrales bacterium]